MQGGGEQRRGIHTPKLPDQHHHPPTHSPTPNSERPYISIEHLIERTKDTYYEALAASTYGWNDNVNDYAPFVNYLLGVILTACKEFDERIGEVSDWGSNRKPAKEQRIGNLFERTLSPLSKADILQQLPDISASTVERTLKTLLDNGTITKLGAGRGTRYVKNR